MPAPIPIPDAYDNFCPNYSSTLLPVDNRTVGLEIASRWDGTVCRPYFARGPLIDTTDGAEITNGSKHRLVNNMSGLCLDVATGSTAAGAMIQQYTCNGLPVWSPVHAARVSAERARRPARDRGPFPTRHPARSRRGRLRQTSAAPPLTAQVRRVLGTALQSNEAHIDRVAQKLGITARSLQRRFKEEGSSFQAMREEVRRELAQRYLDDDLAITENSLLLGFSEPSAFFRAFKRWTGLTPIESRALRRATVSA